MQGYMMSCMNPVRSTDLSALSHVRIDRDRLSEKELIEEVKNDSVPKDFKV